MSNSLWPHGLYTPWNSPGQNTGVDSLSLLQGIFPTQELNPGLPYCRQILYQLSHQGNPRILEWVAYPFSRGSRWPRNRTRVPCIAGRFFPNWAMREAIMRSKYTNYKEFKIPNHTLCSQGRSSLWQKTGWFSLNRGDHVARNTVREKNKPDSILNLLLSSDLCILLSVLSQLAV